MVGGAGVVVTGWKQALICNLVFTGFVPLVLSGVILISTFEAYVPSGKTNGFVGSVTCKWKAKNWCK